MKGLGKKVLSMMLALTLTLGIISFNDTEIYAASPKLETSSVVNPMYADLNVRTFTTPSASPCNSYAATNSSFNTVNDAAKYVRAQMVKRATTIVFDMNMKYYSTLVSEIFSAAMTDDLNGASSEGDYLFAHWKSYNSRASYTSTKATITMNLTYLTTYMQEQKVDERVKQILDSLNVYSADDYTKVKAVHDYIVKNVSYDYSYSSHSAYDAAINKKAVCQGYATFTYKLLKELGVGVRYITGTGNGGGHAWNLVNVDSKWYNTDNTWDENLSDDGEICYKYFLKGSSEFDLDHTRDSKFNTTEFNKNFPTSTSLYKNPLLYSVPEPVVVNNVGGFKYTSTTSSIKLSWDKTPNVSGYEIWMYKSSAGGYTKQKTITSQSTLSYTRSSLYSSSASKYKIRAYKTIDGVKHYSDFSSVLYASTKPLKPSLTVTSTVKGQAKLTWTNTSSRNSGYQVRRATSKEGTYYLKKTTTSKSYTNTGITSGKTYYYKVRAFKTLANGKKVYGSYSYIKSVTIK